ncbi:MAG: hypothetical protein ACYCZO_15950 [Daejeonella sp.]
MKRSLLLISVLTSGVYCIAQPSIIKQDMLIKKMVEEVSDKNIEGYVRKLVAFETRNSMSDTLSATIGIGAARNWIRSEMARYSGESGGSLKAEFDVFTQPADGRPSGFCRLCLHSKSCPYESRIPGKPCSLSTGT